MSRIICLVLLLTGSTGCSLLEDLNLIEATPERNPEKILGDVRSGFNEAGAEETYTSIGDGIFKKHELSFLKVQKDDQVIAQPQRSGSGLKVKDIQEKIRNDNKVPHEFIMNGYQVYYYEIEAGEDKLQVSFGFEPAPGISGYLNDMRKSVVRDFQALDGIQMYLALGLLIIVGLVLLFALLTRFSDAKGKSVKSRPEFIGELEEDLRGSRKRKHKRGKEKPGVEFKEPGLDPAPGSDPVAHRHEKLMGPIEEGPTLNLGVGPSAPSPKLATEAAALASGTTASAPHAPAESGGDFPDPELEQERWYLPGFQALDTFVPEKVELDRLGFGDTDRGEFLFIMQNYRFDDNPDFPGKLADLDGFAKAFLRRLSDQFVPEEVLLFLRNNRGRYRARLQLRGTTFVSGAALENGENGDLDEAIFKELNEGHSVFQGEGRTIYFPVLSARGMIGVLRYTGVRALYKKDELARLWTQIKKFGDQLFQARVYEQTAVDQTSTLLNGLQFHNDLKYEFHLKNILQNRRGLGLIAFGDETRSARPADMRIPGLALRGLLPEKFHNYRIAADVFAFIGPALSASELEEYCAEYLAYLRKYREIDIAVGYALLEDWMGTAQEWFDSALAAQTRARADGPNHYRFFERTRRRAVFAAN